MRESLHLARVPPPFERRSDDTEEVVTVARFDQVLEGASLDGVDRLMNSTRRGDHDEGKGGVACLDPVEKLESVEPFHPDVAHDDVERLALHDLESGARIRRLLARMTVGSEQEFERVTHLAVVIDNQHPRLHGEAR